MAALKISIMSGEALSIFSEVRKLKEQRWGMVYTSTQYDYLYDFAEHEIVKLQNGILSANSEYDSEEEDNEGEGGKK